MTLSHLPWHWIGLTLYLSIHTLATLREFLRKVSLPLGFPYGRRFLKMCPTLEHGIISSLPPHIQICQTGQSQDNMISNFFFNDKLWLFKIPHYLNSKTSFLVTCLFESIKHCRKKYITVIMNTYITYLFIYIWYKIYPIPYLTCLLPSILGTCNILLHLHACYTQVLTHISMFHLP